MDKTIQVILYRALCNSLHAAIDTGNQDEIAAVLKDAKHSLHAAQIDRAQYADLEGDVRAAGYDW